MKVSMFLRVLVIVCVGAGQGGCSNDGDLFAGTVNHNEGAVDYRVASLTWTGEEPPDPLSDGYMTLGGGANTPYVPLASAGDINSFSRTRVPEYVITGQEEVERKENLLRSATEAAAARASELASAVDRLTKTRDEVAAADARITRAKEDLDKYDKATPTPTTEVTTPDPVRQLKVNELAAAREEHTKASGAVVIRTKDVDDARAKKTVADTELEPAKRAVADAKAALAIAVNTMNDGIEKGTVDRETVQSVRVTLKQAYLRDFAEPGAVGEVAVLMTVKESRTGLGQQEPKAGRVVYYSEGVRKQAFMNFRDQPVYGPIRYGGDDLQIRVSVIELDESDNAVAGAMLKTVAQIGSVAYPPSSLLLGALDQIGAALLTLNGPDLEWDYLMRLSSRPPEDLGDRGQAHAGWLDAWLRDGYYVLMRSDTSSDSEVRRRISQEEWNKLHLDVRTGVIYRKKSNGAFEQYTDHSYLVFTVQTGFDSSQLDIAQEAAELSTVLAAYGAGSDGVNKAAEALAKTIGESIPKLKGRKQQQQKDRNTK